MSWSYAPGVGDRNWVRFVIGDTDSTDKQLQNEEIDAALSNEGSKYAAAAVCAEALAGKYSRQSDKQVGPLRISTSQRAERYEKLAKRLRASVGRKVAAYAGGISESDVQAVRDDTDRYRGAFRERMFDIPGADPQTELDDELNTSN